jgi:dihydrofolate reductase
MAKLIYSALTSLDGYIADEDGNFDWAAPDEEVHTFVNDLERKVGTYLYERRMYEVMRYWETALDVTGRPLVEQDYAHIWRSADKIVYSKTLQAVSSARTWIERNLDPEAVRRMKGQTQRHISVGGPDLAAQALEAGLVDEYHLFVAPNLVGAANGRSLQTSAWSSNCWTNAVSRAAYFTFATAQGRMETATPDVLVEGPKSILWNFARVRLAPERRGQNSEGYRAPGPPMTNRRS